MGGRLVVLAHDFLDGLGGFLGVVERDGADVVVQHVRLDDAVQKVPTDEAKFTVDRGSGTAGEGPRFVGVVREAGVGVLQVRDGH